MPKRRNPTLPQPPPLSDHLDRIKQFEDMLAAEQEKRPKRDKYVQWGNDTVPAWLKAELEMLLREINSQRDAADLPALNMRDLRRVETMACGHTDYSHKLALYCAELCTTPGRGLAR